MSNKTVEDLWWEVVIKAVGLYSILLSMRNKAEEQERAWHEIAEVYRLEKTHKPASN